MANPIEEEIGTLVVVVLKAKDLQQNSFFKQDVYATVTLNGTSKSTKVDIKGGQHPLWDDEFRFPVIKHLAPKFRDLKVSCFAKEHRNDDLIGEGTLDITETLRTGKYDDWVKFERGEIYLEMTYYSNGPAPVATLAPPKEAPLMRRPSKLSPADRTWRPPQPHTPPKSTSPARADQRYPAKDNSIPDLLKAGGGARPNPAGAPTAASLPSSLRPGPGNIPGGQSGRQPSVASTIPAQSHTPTPAPLANPYGPAPSQAPGPLANPYQPSTPSNLNGPAPAQNPAQAKLANPYQFHNPHSPTPVPQGPYGPPTEQWRPEVQNYQAAPAPGQYTPPTLAQEQWRPDPGPIDFSFPVPNVPQPAPGSYEQGPQHRPYDQQGPYDYQRPYGQGTYDYQRPYEHPPADSYYGPDHPRTRTLSYVQQQQQQPQVPKDKESDDLPDPYLQKRYQTPLPLPPGSSSPPSLKKQPPLPPKAETPPPVKPKKEPKKEPLPVKPKKDDARMQQLRAAEEAAAKRKAQEDLDLALARELSSQEDPPPPPKPVVKPRDIAEEARIERIRVIEEQAAKKKAQEEKDAALARQLDQELNLD